MDREFFENNRRKMFGKMEKGSLMVLFSGEAPVRSGDSLYDFFVNRNFFYVTGIDRDKMIYMALKTADAEKETLFIPESNGHMARWIGENMTVCEAENISGIKDIKNVSAFMKCFEEVKKDVSKIYIDMDDKFDRPLSTKALRFGNRVKSKYPDNDLLDAQDIFTSLRQKKEPEEVECIKKAISITKDGIYSMMKNSKAGMMEYELEAYFDHELKKNGVKRPAFTTIAAGGKNATVLHYEENDSIVNDKEMILFDLGASWGNYSADITRTFPVNGRFTDEQKDLYNMVLKGQKLVIDMIRPGVPFAELNKALRAYYVEEMGKRGFVKNDEELSEYYFHSVSHHLGLETHDVGDRNGLLEEGMIITVEPGIYISELGIGIRIEDDVLVTADGCEVLSKDIIKEADDIERFMCGE